MKPEEMRDDIPMDVREALAAFCRSETAGIGALKDIIRAKPKTVILPRAEIPAPLEKWEHGDDYPWVLDSLSADGVRRARSWEESRAAMHRGLAWGRLKDAKAALAAFTAREPVARIRGAEWTPHTPGDPIPCHESVEIVVRLRGGETEEGDAGSFDWSDDNNPGDIVAWRYAR